VKRTEETKIRASLIQAIDQWWEQGDIGGAPRPVLGDSTLVHMAEAALGVLLAVDDLYEALRDSGELKDEESE
jgi:hypothetical protein